MKKISKIIVLFAIMFSFAYIGSSFTSANEEVTVYLDVNETAPIIENAGFATEVPEFLMYEEALYCKVEKKNGDVISCWFCKCSDIM